MAREITEFPSGVSGHVFDAHTHPYRKLTQLSVDGAGTWVSPVPVDVADDAEVNVTDSNKVAAVGVTVSTEPTGAPN